MRAFLAGFLITCLAAGCSADRQPVDTRAAQPGATQGAAAGSIGAVLAGAPLAASTIASWPDRGELAEYGPVSASIERGAYTWHPVKLSEEHAIRAIAEGELRLTSPDGRLIRLRYDHHVEHPDGNWTWIGREPGSAPGTEAVITFGEKAVFGSIPDGDAEPLRLMMAAGRTWLVETDSRMLTRLQGHSTRPRKPDFLMPPRFANIPAPSGTSSAATAASAPAEAMATAATTVDLLLGYTNGFASRLGGQSAAVTRLTYLVDIANQAFVNSQVDAQLRLVGTQQVTYADATSNDQALYDLTGVECTQTPSGHDCEFVGIPAALQPLHEARDRLGADLVSLVRKFNDPENGGCGVAWLNGGGQVPITAADEVTGLSVVSDSGGNEFPDGTAICREEALVHELGHNMGSAHDRNTAEGEDNVLQPSEYGRYPYSFGYKTGLNGFFTVMAYGDTGQQAYRVFSNPSINSCGGSACGIVDQADNARSLRQTIPIVAAFRAPVTRAAPSDFDGDRRSDILWRHAATGLNTIWLAANSALRQAVSAIDDLRWKARIGDFNGDGRADILWRHDGTGVNTIWRSADSTTRQTVARIEDLRWQVVGIGDFNGDGRSDILWRHSGTGANTVWLSANSTTRITMASITDLRWQVAGIGDFDGDGRSDILWRHSGTGLNTIWRSANSATRQNVAAISDLRWQAAGIGDFNGDGRSDILWRHGGTGLNTIWLSANVETRQAVGSVADLRWQAAGVGDFNGDGRSDILWRHDGTGLNAIWLSANSGTRQTVSPVEDVRWQAIKAG